MGIEGFLSAQINDGIAAYIKRANVDPLKTMIKGTQPLGEIHLGVPVATTFDYSVSELTGLSTFAVKPKIDLGTVDWTKLIDGELPLEGKFSATGQFQTIAAKLHGGLQASFEGLSKSVDLNGTLSIEGLRAELDGEIHVKAEGNLIEGVKVCVTAIDVQKLGLDHTAAHIQLNELGEFGHLLDHAVQVIDEHVGRVIEKGLDSVLMSVANAGVNSFLPFCREFQPSDMAGAAMEEAGKGLLGKIGSWLNL